MAEVGKTMNPSTAGGEWGRDRSGHRPADHRPRLGRHPRAEPPLPRWWLWTFYATIVFALVYVVLYPAIPLLNGGSGGVLGYSTRGDGRGRNRLARQAQAGSLDEIANLPLEEIKANADLDRFAVAGGRSAFLVNCIQCHGTGAAGSPGYANLNDDDWLWGGTLDDIHQTIAYGIRSNHPDTRISEMPAFGDILTRPQIVAVANYVLSLAGKEHDAALAAEGAAIYAEPSNCVSCHGEGGVGDRSLRRAETQRRHMAQGR